MGRRNIVLSRFAKGRALDRMPNAANVPRIVERSVAPMPMMRLFMIDRRHASAVVSCANHRREYSSMGYVRKTLDVKARGRIAAIGMSKNVTTRKPNKV
jgi:hypothetical protein